MDGSSEDGGSGCFWLLAGVVKSVMLLSSAGHLEINVHVLAGVGSRAGRGWGKTKACQAVHFISSDAGSGTASASDHRICSRSCHRVPFMPASTFLSRLKAVALRLPRCAARRPHLADEAVVLATCSPRAPRCRGAPLRRRPLMEGCVRVLAVGAHPETIFGHPVRRDAGAVRAGGPPRW